MKRTLLLLFFVASTILVKAQLAVTEFYLAETDQTANLPGTEQYDQNGQKCALIKVETTQKGFSFDVGIMGVTKVEEDHTGEIWVYVPHSVRRITIQHAQLGTLRDYFFPENIVSARTYIMRLAAGTVTTIIEKAQTQQFVEFHVKPAYAMLTFQNELLPLSSDGIGSKLVDFGTYEFHVSCTDYRSDAGTVTINDPKQKKIVNIELQPAFGTLIVKGNNAEGAVVYLDNRNIGQVPLTKEHVSSGKHVVQIAKKFFLTYIDTIIIKDELPTTVNVRMESNYATLHLVSLDNAEIWVNDKKLGTGDVLQEFEAGIIQIETRKKNHMPTIMQFEVEAGKRYADIELPAPKPINSQLSVITTPIGAEIYIDGKLQTQTSPCILSTLIGEHNIKIRKTGFADYDDIIDIIPNKTNQLRITLDEHGNYNTTKTTNTTPKTSPATTNVQASGNNMTIQVGDVSFQMVLIEGGTFLMGEEGKGVNTAVNDFYIGQTEVTQELWTAVMKKNPSVFVGQKLPVENISYNDCLLFIEALNRLTGKTFCLPTEAQWEYAAKGGRNKKETLYSGSNSLGAVGWSSVNSGKKTHAVAFKNKNEIGVFDMTGNVWEWCQGQALRGGGYTSLPNESLITVRSTAKADSKADCIGLRLVLLP